MNFDQLLGGVSNYAGREPSWTRIGTTLGRLSSLEEIARAANVWCGTEKVQLGYRYSDSGRYVDLPVWVTCRDDEGIETGIYGVVGEGYPIIDHLPIARALEALAGEGRWETMGTLGSRRAIIWGQINLKDAEFEVLKGDVFQSRLAFTAAHCPTATQGTRITSAVQLFECTTRMQCINTTAAAISEGKDSAFRITHRGNVQQKLANAQAAIQELKESNISMKEKLLFLSRKRITPEVLDAVVEYVLGKKPEEKEESKLFSWNEKKIDMMVHAAMPINTPQGQDGSGYQFFNGVTSAAEHGDSGILRQRGGKQAVATELMFGKKGEMLAGLLDMMVEEMKNSPDLVTVAARSQAPVTLESLC